MSKDDCEIKSCHENILTPKPDNLELDIKDNLSSFNLDEEEISYMP